MHALRLVPASIFLLFAALSYATPASAIEVAVDELKKAPKVEFENYTGAPGKIESVQSIDAIGAGLADGVRRAAENRRVYFNMKYSVIHAVSNAEKEKLSADIILIEKSARVDHIRNVRRIIAAYLAGRYGYSGKNARALAYFITYYNAVYRGDLPYFTGIYKSVVLRYLGGKNAGISTKWYEWPGRTRLVIPLTEGASQGSLDSIDPDVITGEKVRDEARRENDEKSRETRKDMITLKENIQEENRKDLAESKEKTAREKESVRKEKEAQEKKKEEIARDKERIDRETKRVEKEKEEAKKIPDETTRKTREEEITKKEETLKKEEEKVVREEEKLREEEKKTAGREEKVAEKEKENAEKEKLVARRDEEIVKEKKELRDDSIKTDIEKVPEKAKEELREKEADLAEKEKELDKREDALKSGQVDRMVFGDRIYYLRIDEWIKNGQCRGEMLMIDAYNQAVLFRSPVTTISGRRYDVFSEGVVVITRKEKEYEMEHNLTLLDREKLTARIVGTDNVFWRSFIEIRDSFVYAVVNVDGYYYLGKFDLNLKLVARSAEKVYEDTFITFYQDTIYINRSDRKVIALKKEDLSLKAEVRTGE